MAPATHSKGYGFGPPPGLVPEPSGSPLITAVPLTPLEIAHVKRQIVGLAGHINFMQRRLDRLNHDLSFLDPVLVNSVSVPGYPPPTK
jgi:hypothetical protein